jgi:hypothetical protein
MLHSSARHGAALIIAIVILTGLLILGLPFLFTQSGSLSGTRSYAHDNLASVGQATAHNMGMQVAAQTVQRHWDNNISNGKKIDWTSLREPLEAINPTSGVKFLDTNRIQLDTRQHTYEYTDPNPAIIGITIEDESGKLNPNYLDQKAWSDLLLAVGIKDWQNVSTSGAGYGSLTVALAELRYTLPGKRITQFIQLRLAQPVIPPQQTPPPNPLPVLRGPLTDAELALLKPHLTLHTLGTGGGGQIDIGTVIDVHPDGLYRRAALDSEPPGNVLSFPVPGNMVGVGSTLILGTQNGDVSVPALSAQQVDIGDSVKVDVPPTVNIHTATEKARVVLFNMGAATPNGNKDEFTLPPTPAKFTGLHGIESSQIDYFGNKINGLDAAQPLHHLFLGSEATVLPSQQGDPGISPTTIGVSQDASNKPLLESGVTLIRISGSARAEFPGSGYAQLIGKKSGTNEQVTELIYYNSSLPLSSGDAQASAPSILVNVRRGRIKPDGTLPGPFEFFADTLKIKPIIPRDLPPLSIRSQGVVAIESSATVLDRADNIAASEQHRAIAQALPQDAVLEERFEKQAQLHNLIAQRHGSLLTSFPKPYPRISDLYPDDQDNEDVPDIDLTDSKEAPGLKSAPMRSLLTSSHLDHEWTLPFSGKKDTALPTGVYKAENDMTPEGLRLIDTKDFSYPNPSAGFISNRDNGNQLVQINGRQLSLWIRPDENWDNKRIALLDMRVPAGNSVEDLKGESAEQKHYDQRNEGGRTDPDETFNRFSLIYEPGVKHLVLTLNPGAIMRRIMSNEIKYYGPSIPRASYTPNTLLDLKSTSYPAINLESFVYPDKVTSKPPGMACLVNQQAIQHRYFIGDYLRKGQSYLIQVAFTGNHPGGMSIMVDGLVGRDVSRVFSEDGPMTIPGDHLTLPRLLLRNDLPGDYTEALNGSQALERTRDNNPITIRLDAWAPAPLIGPTVGPVIGAAAVKALLPPRGMIRIGNEYISYQSIDDDGILRDCVRARRQHTTANDWSTSHRIEAHRAGDLVYPGGFAIKNVSLLRGGCSLKDDFPEGSASENYRTWAATNGIHSVGASTITFTRRLSDFPERGFVFVGNWLYFFDNKTSIPSSELKNLHAWRTEMRPDPLNPSELKEFTGWVAGLVEDINDDTRAYLASVELNGDPTTPGAYAGVVENGNPMSYAVKVDSSGYNNDPLNTKLLQLYEPSPFRDYNFGRCEWVAYSHIDSRTNYPMQTDGKRLSFIVFLTAYINGKDSSGNDIVTKYYPGCWFDEDTRNGLRGQQRTVFAKHDLTSFDRDNYEFRGEKNVPGTINTRVIPVQTNVPLGYLCETGDIVTIQPTIAGAKNTPRQMCIRYAPDDVFPWIKGSPSHTQAWDVINRYFAFTEALPPESEWNSDKAPVNILCWPCWTPEKDLSPMNNDWSNAMSWSLPWANNFSASYTVNDPTRVIHLGQQINPDSFSGINATVDALHAGTQPGSDILQKNPVRVKAYKKRPDKPNPSDPDAWEDISTGFDDLDLSKELLLESTGPIFTPPYGLVSIGGEVFAYKNDLPAQSTQAKIIARGLLGSVPRPHVGDEIIMHLPLGPVDEIRNALNENLQGEVLFAGQSIDAPAVLLVSRDGKKHELVTFPNGHTAPWLRGLYNTTPVKWAARPSDGSIINDAPIAIGWWPRYPPALPRDTLTQNADIRAALLRCRSYAWANFPFRFHQTYFKGNESSSTTILDDGAGLFDFTALVLRGGLSWDNWPTTSKMELTETTGKLNVLTGLFLGDQFMYTGGSSRFPNNGDPAFVDGVDVRVIWTYLKPPIKTEDAPSDWLRNAARNANHAPMIGPTIIRGRAPSTVLSVER